MVGIKPSVCVMRWIGATCRMGLCRNRVSEVRETYWDPWVDRFSSSCGVEMTAAMVEKIDTMRTNYGQVLSNRGGSHPRRWRWDIKDAEETADEPEVRASKRNGEDYGWRDISQRRRFRSFWLSGTSDKPCRMLDWKRWMMERPPSPVSSGILLHL